MTAQIIDFKEKLNEHNHCKAMAERIKKHRMNKYDAVQDELNRAMIDIVMSQNLNYRERVSLDDVYGKKDD